MVKNKLKNDQVTRGTFLLLTGTQNIVENKLLT